MDGNDPSAKTPIVSAMQARAEVCNAVMSGTLGMRAKGAIYLPKEPAETDDAYSCRLNKTVLFPAFSRALDTMVGKPFGELITLDEDMPQEIKGCMENVDLAGRDLDSFARQVFKQTLSDGIGWILVDNQNTAKIAQNLGKPSLTLEDERNLGVRPYLVHVPLSAVLGWRIEITNGVPRLTQFRHLETVDEPDGMFGSKEVQRIRVWEPGLVTVYIEQVGPDGKKQWIPDAQLSGPIAIPEIPCVTLYTGRTGIMTAQPPLEDLAWLNVEHWQSQSDQRHILHVARVPLLFGKNLEAGPDGKIVIGANRLIKGGSADSDLKYVEHQGNAIEAGRQDLQDIEDKMVRVAGEILSRVSGEKTATETTREGREGGSRLKQWVWTFQDELEECCRFMAQWMGQKDGGSLTIDTDWDDAELGADMLTALTSARTTSNISRDSYLWNLKQKGLLPPDRSIEDEKNLIDTEAATPDNVGADMSVQLSAADRLKARAAAQAKAQNPDNQE